MPCEDSDFTKEIWTMPNEPLPPISQEYFDENRERFEAETTQAPNKAERCNHFFKRISAIEVGCANCTASWFDHGTWNIEDGKLIGLKSLPRPLT